MTDRCCAAGTDAWDVRIADCVATMALDPDRSYDVVVTDPPYMLGFMNKGWDKARPEALDTDAMPGHRGHGRHPGQNASIARARSIAAQNWHHLWAVEALRVAKPGAWMVAFGAPRTAHRLACAIEDAGWELRDCLLWLYGSGFPKSRNFGDRGTALKPGWEPIVLARAPLDGTVEQNFVRWGTGTLNIGDTRLPGPRPETVRGAGGQHGIYGGLPAQGAVSDDGAGRWPPNVALDEEAAALLDAEVGDRQDGRRPGRRTTGFWADKPEMTQDAEQMGGGPPSRFFYCPKASRSEREAGCDALPSRTGAAAVDRQEGAAGTKSPRAGAGRTAVAVRNHHPTVKPIALMRWLVRLVTPPGGLVLDPFAGSGSTGCAAVLEGRRFHGIEIDVEYARIASARLRHHAGQAAINRQVASQGTLL